jgi:uncharacterized protein (TIGR03086 family)
MTNPALADLDQALAATGRLVTAVGADQWAASTPCPEWNAAELVRHVAHGNLHAAARVRGEEGDVPPPDDEDPAAGYARSAAALHDAFAEPDALARTVAMPVGPVPGAVALDLRVTELLVHGWDLARATGQQLEVADPVAQRALDFSGGFLARIPPDRTPFGSPQQVPDEAPVLDRLVSLLGREVGA